MPPAEEEVRTEMSLSETNKMREKLGLAPLAPKMRKRKQDPNAVTNKPDVVQPMGRNDHIQDENVQKDEWGRVLETVGNIGDAKHAEKIKKKIELRREKRKLESRISSFTLGGSTKAAKKRNRVETVEDDDEDEDDDLDMAAWVRNQGQAAAVNKRKHEALARRYQEEMMIAAKAQYTSKDMKGMTVDHKLEDINLEGDTILTLQDKKILDGGLADKDVLQNVNVADREQDRRHMKNKLTGINYEPWRDMEAEALLGDSISFGKKSAVLKKYDEAIHGSKYAYGTENDFFKIGEDGQVDMQELEERNEGKREKRAGAQSLKLPEYQEQTDYYETDFKKSKNSTKKRKKEETKSEPKLGRNLESRLGSKKAKKSKTLQADDLIDGDAIFNTFGQDRKKVQNKNRRRVEKDEEYDFENTFFKKLEKIEKKERKAGKDLMKIEDVGEAKIIKAKIKQKNRFKYLDREKFAEEIAQNRDKEEDETFGPIEPGSIRNYKVKKFNTMTTTEEFCRSIKVDQNTESESKSKSPSSKKAAHETVLEDDQGYTMTDLNEAIQPKSEVEKLKSENKTVHEMIGIDEETKIDSGMSAFLKLAKEKRILDLGKLNRPLSMGVSQHMKEKILAKQGTYHSIDDRYRYDHDIDRLGAWGGKMSQNFSRNGKFQKCHGLISKPPPSQATVVWATLTAQVCRVAKLPTFKTKNITNPVSVCLTLTTTATN